MAGQGKGDAGTDRRAAFPFLLFFFFFFFFLLFVCFGVFFLRVVLFWLFFFFCLVCSNTWLAISQAEASRRLLSKLFISLNVTS